MASEVHRGPTYPVWVGNLKETVADKDLKRVFSKHGQIASCKVMVDERGNSKGFGYVNFYSEADAESAAAVKQGFKISGVSIKTKGPALLSSQGHLARSPPQPEGPSSPGLNFRPLTDCSFFVVGKKCKKGGNCPYRHSEVARSSSVTCPQWMERHCLDVDCPYRHPGSWEKRTDSSTDLVTSSGLELIKCGGRCGSSSCAAHFASKEDLSRHVKTSRLLQCRHCRAIFFNELEFRDHKKVCRNRVHSGSTDASSDSIDIEEVSSDSDSTSTESDEEDPGDQYGSTAYAEQISTIHKDVGAIHRSASANVFHTSPSKKRPRDRRSSESNTKVKQELSSSKFSSPQKAHKGRVDSGRATGLAFGQTNIPESSSGGVYPGPGGYGMRYNDSEPVYCSSDSSDSEESDEGDEEYSPSEMTRLLSLNAEDMYEGGEEGEERETGEYKGQGSEWMDGSSRERRKEMGRTGAKSEGSRMSGALDEDTAAAVKSPHRVKLEPVGVFWDIENCPVPLDKSAFSLAAKMRRVFFEGKREAEFMCVCDVTKERKDVTDALHKAQVTLVHVNAIAKNAADDKLRQSLRRFAHTYPAPSTVVLISGDVNFSSELTDLRHIHNITTILVHNRQASEALKVFAHTLINFDEFLEDVDAPHEPQHSNLPRVVIVKGLPTTYPQARISQRLDRLSDNCGGKVLKVDVRAGTAKILFRTPEWANKALKRMAGEDVFGCKIKTSLETQPPPHVQKNASQQLKNLTGFSLSKSFPPRPQAPPTHQVPTFISPRPQRPLLMSPPQQQYQRFPPPPGPISPPHQGQRPLFSPPHPGGGGRFPLIRPGVPPGPPYSPPKGQTLVPPPLPAASPTQIRGPHGKILIFKIPAVSNIDQLNGQVVGIHLEACVKAERLILWHNFTELEVLLRVDIIQTASAMNEVMIKTLGEKNQLKKQVVDAFMDRCAKSIQQVSRSHRLPWEVTLCGWSLDEEEERVVRSQVVALLRHYPPYYWTKWSTFKQRYSEIYSSAISEMAIHNTCRGAVQILGNPGNSQNQVIIFFELSPLLKVVNNPHVHQQLQKNFIKLLNMQSDKKIKLLDFVRVYKDSNLGVLPESSSGKLLQEIITTTPNVAMVGVKPSNIFVTLGDKDKGPAVTTPQNLPGISAAFVNLLVYTPTGEIPMSKFQQEYQTLYRKSFRVSDYLPSATGLRDLLENCSGIKLKDLPSPKGGVNTIVCLDDARPSTEGTTTKKQTSASVTGSPTIQKSASSTNVRVDVAPKALAVNIHGDGSVSPVPEGIPTSSVQLFKKDCIEVLSSMPDRRIPLVRFPEAYYKCKGEIFSLARYNAKKIILLVQAIPDVVRVLGDKENKILELIIGTKRDFESHVQKMLYSMPNHSTTLDRFMVEYEKHSGTKLSTFYGHPKLIKLLEDIPETAMVKGGGANRRVILHPRCVFVMDIAQLAAAHPEGLLISGVVPAYKEMFERDLNINSIGFPKLLRALESIQDVIKITGSGASRKILPKRGTSTGVAAPPPTVSLPPPQMLVDEIVAILMTRHSNKFSLIELTTQYNTCFRYDQPQVSKEQLFEAVKKLPNFKITGSGATTYIQCAPLTPERSQGGGSKAKRKVKTSESSEQSEGTVTETAPKPQTAVAADAVDKVAAPPSPTKKLTSGMDKVIPETPDAMQPTELQRTIQPASVARSTPVSTQPAVPQSTAVTQPILETQSTVVTQPTSVNQPTAMITQPPEATQATAVTTPAVVNPPTAVVAQPAVAGQSNAPREVSDSDGTRLFSETRRLLQIHHEHAMTLMELVVKFKECEEPIEQSSEELYHVLMKHNTKDTSSGSGKPVKPLEISYIPSSVGDSIVQLGMADCFWKLSKDLAYLFIYHPTPTFTMSVSELESAYAECYGRKLVPAIYAAKNVDKLFTWKQVVQIMQFNSGSRMCQLKRSSSLQALATLLAELLFTSGKECKSPEDLMDIYLQHFGVPLLLENFGVESVISLIQLPEVKEVVQLVHVQVRFDSYQVKPVLTSNALLTEQLRQLLTTHNGCIPVDQVEAIYMATFGIQTHINIADIIGRNKLMRVAPQVVSVIGNKKWLVWAPTGRPYPSRGRKTSIHLSRSEPSNKGMVIHSEDSQARTTETLKDDRAMATEVNSGTVEGVQPTNSSKSVDVSESSDRLNSAEFPMKGLIDDVKVSTDISANGTSTADRSSSNDFLESNVDPSTTTKPPLTDEGGEVSADTYGFLEETLEPELMAELRASGEEHQQKQQTLGELLSSQPLSEKAIQLLIHFAKPLSEIDLEASDSDGDDDQEMARLAKPSEPIDYLKSGLTPDQVLEEMRKLKEQSGGYLSPEKMEPFLTYFGELSSRELDRLESLEEDKKPKPKKGAAKKKRMMAIRFPGKSPASPQSNDDDPYKEQRLYSTELLRDKLPVAPDFENMSDSSDSDGSCPRPLERKEYIQTLLKRGIPSLTDEEIMRATQVVGNGQSDHVATSSSYLDSPPFETKSEAEMVNDLPRPLLSSSEINHAASHKLFDNSQLVLDPGTFTVTENEVTEWPDFV